MTSKMTKQMIPNSINIEITHLSCDQNKQLLANNNNTRKNVKTTDESIVETIERQMAYHLRKTLEEEIESLEKLEKIEFKDNTPNQRYYYEEKEVYRLRTTVTPNFGPDFVKSKYKYKITKILMKICTNGLFSNTLFSIIDHKFNWFKFLSINDEINPGLKINGLKSFSFGSLFDLTNFVEHYNSSEEKKTWNVSKDDIMADFKLDRKTLDLIFRLTTGGSHGKHTKSIRYKLEYDYKAIISVTFSINDSKEMLIYLTLKHPPILFKVAIDDMNATEKNEYYQKYEKIDRRRPHKQKTYKNLDEKHGIHTYDIKNDEIWVRVHEFDGCHKKMIGKSNVLLLKLALIQNKIKSEKSGHDLSDPFRLLGLIKRFTQIPIYFGFIERKDCPSHDFPKQLIDKLSVCLRPLKVDPFPIIYAFKAFFSLNFISSDELFVKQKSDEFIESVVNYYKEDPKTIEETLLELCALNDRNSIFCSINALKHIFEEFKERNEKYKTEELIIDSPDMEVVNIRKCILTPTRFIMLPPQPTLKSRFIDKYEKEYTIRLSVREDNLQSLQFSMGNHLMDLNSVLKKMFKKPLMEGIPIGNRLYEFLGSSTSQLRDTGLILYAKDKKGKTAKMIRKEIGDLSEIKNNVPKYVARLGLAFSQVMTHIEVHKSLTKVEPDIERNDYNFSDGLGRVSMDVMEKVYKQLKIECQHRPTAMQIRYGGVKGMLVVDPTLKGHEKIIFRESMVKYKSNADKLGIIKLSAPRPLYLNRPLITILDQLGIEDKVFLNMLGNDLKQFSYAMMCECSATKLLQSSSTLGIPYKKLFKSEIPFVSEPIFRQIIDSVINHRIHELKIKGRIKVPMDSGRTVFGVLDETKTLEYGQVFVQLSKVNEENKPFEGEDNTLILKGEIMVTKFPCLHPGDVRKLQAIDVKGLHHIKDCIVFPQNGCRPHSNEMAGSDLDGDEYAVIWDKSLIFERDNEKAMDFPDSEPTLLKKEITEEELLPHIVDFYCNYIVSNNVGLLARAHLARADTEKDGIFSEVCMNLAKKYSIALDFPKTGRIETLEWKERPFIYPDFMEKFALKRTKLSNKILGQLYRQCDRISLGLHSNKRIEIKAEPNKRFKIEGYEKFMDSAKVRYNAYKKNIDNLLNRFGVENEATLLSGTFSQTSKYMSGRSETNDVRDLLENIINKLFIRFKELFKSDSKNDSKEEKFKRVSAWYLVPFEDDDKQRYFGFSWTITEELCELFKSKRVPENEREEHNCVEFAANMLDDFFVGNYLYKEPEFPEPINTSDKRQQIMEKRCETSEVIIRAWLERQDHLFFKRYNQKRILISSTDCVMSDMDRKLRRKLMNTRIKVLGEARNSEQPLKSAGSLVMSFFTELMNEWFNSDNLNENNRIVDTPLVKFGFSSFITLNHFFKTRDISHIVCVNSKFKISLKAIIRDEVFFIPLPVIRNSDKDGDDRFDTGNKFTRLMVQRPEFFIENLKRLSGALDIFLEPYPLKMKCLRFYYLMTVTGTVWSIQTVKNFVCHPSFIKIVANSNTKPIKSANLYSKAERNRLQMSAKKASTK